MLALCYQSRGGTALRRNGNRFGIARDSIFSVFPAKTNLCADRMFMIIYTFRAVVNFMRFHYARKRRETAATGRLGGNARDFVIAGVFPSPPPPPPLPVTTVHLPSSTEPTANDAECHCRLNIEFYCRLLHR